ncbi:MAG: hypothetical protein Roseis2KO_26950 [Roseivirga sp.]
MSIDFSDIDTTMKTVLAIYQEAWKDTSQWKSNMDIALHLLEKLRSEHPANTIVLTNLGAVLSDLGQHKKALLRLLKAVNLGFEDRNLYFNIGVVKMNINEERATAMTYFDRARELQAHAMTIEAYFDPHGR